MKVRRISDFQSKIQFPNFDNDYARLLSSFQLSDLGKIYSAIPWQELVEVFGLKDNFKGPKSIFSPKGKLALMFLKHYACCSDKKLIEQLNANYHYQLFCDIVVAIDNPLTNYKIVSEIRCDLGNRLDVNKTQHVLATEWRQYLENKDSVCFDATCYESYLRYPTDIKLLYEAVTWNYNWLKRINFYLGRKTIRTKIGKWKKRYSNYSKSKRPSKKMKRALTRALLLLLSKIHQSLTEAEQQFSIITLTDQYWTRRKVTAIVLKQQHEKFYNGVKPTDRIVSLDKPYIRPIVRGKEIKKVEFGAKVHKLQVGGISFIEHISFDNFNEGSRLKQSVYNTQQLTHTKLKMLGADGIYANNANRSFVSQNEIKTDFKRKGRPSVHKTHFSQLAKMITKERASRLEGSFGTDKEHFLLNRIKARTKKTEVLWIFFGIHTSNALKIGRKKAKSHKLVA